MSTNPLTTDTDRAYALAVGLRDLAALATDHSDLARNLRGGFGRVHVSVGHGDDDARERLVAFARAGLVSGATVTEHDDGKWAGVDVAFGPISLHVYADVATVHGPTRCTVEQGDDGVTCRITEYTPRSILAEITSEAGERAA